MIYRSHIVGIALDSFVQVSRAQGFIVTTFEFPMGCTHCEPQKECHISSVDLVLLCMLAVTAQELALGCVVLVVLVVLLL